MIRKYHNHKLQTNPQHREEESHNNHETPGRQAKQNNQIDEVVAFQCRDEDKDQESIQSSTIPDPEHHMGK